MLWKILIFIGVIIGVLAFFRFMNRPPGGGGRGGGGDRKSAGGKSADHADGQSVDLIKCGNCGAFIAPQTVCGHCGK